jgi:hypothetical protein
MTISNADIAALIKALSVNTLRPPPPLVLSGDKVKNWNCFKVQWHEYELARLDLKSKEDRYCAFMCCLGRE